MGFLSGLLGSENGIVSGLGNFLSPFAGISDAIMGSVKAIGPLGGLIAYIFGITAWILTHFSLFFLPVVIFTELLIGGMSIITSGGNPFYFIYQIIYYHYVILKNVLLGITWILYTIVPTILGAISGILGAIVSV